MQNDPFRNLQGLEGQANSLGQSVRNPQAQAAQRADMIKRQLNQGTENLISALCYATGIVALIAMFVKQWKTSSQIRFHSLHALVMWAVLLPLGCIILVPAVALLILSKTSPGSGLGTIGVLAAGLLVIPGGFYMAGLFLASDAMRGSRRNIPFLTQFLYRYMGDR